MFDLYRKFKAAYGQYFTLQGPYRKHTLALVGIVFLNVAVMLLLPMFNVALSTMFEVFMTSELTYGMFFSALKDFFIVVAQYVVLQMASWRLVEWLGQSLAHHKQQNVLQDYYQAGVPYVAQALGQAKNPKDKVDFAHVQVCEAAKTATRFSKLFNDFMYNCPQGIFNFYALWKHSPALTLSVFGRMLVIPRYMVVFAVLYAIVYNVLLHFLSKPLAKASEAASQYEASLKNETHDGVQHAENISLLNAVRIHLQRTVAVLDKKYEAVKDFSNKQFLVQFFITVNGLTTIVVGMCIMAPAMIGKQITAVLGMTLLNFFQSTVTTLSWFYNSGPAFAKLGPSVNTLAKYDAAILEAQQLLEKNKHHVRYNSFNQDAIVFSSVKVDIPSTVQNSVEPVVCKKGCAHKHDLPQSENLPQVDATTLKTHQVIDYKSIPVGSRIKITGESGGGKTTLQRIVAGIWPFGNAEGSITIPFEREEVMYLSQQATFPLEETLWKEICYPHEPLALTPERKAQVEHWMRAIGLEKHIEALEQRKEWPKLLSGGERQRVRMLSVLVHQPKMVFMDESLSGLDPKNYAAISELLNTEPALKKTTFICIVHGHVSELDKADFYNTNFTEWKMEVPAAEPEKLKSVVGL